MSPEAEILFEVGRAQVSGDHSAICSLIRSKTLNWDEVRTFAVRHKMLPLLYWTLAQNPKSLVPAESMREMREAFTTGAAWNLVLISELAKIIKLFEAEGIPLIPYKGPILATLLYGNSALRQCSDIDLLIRKSDLDRARSVLISNGYVPAVPLDSARRKAFLLSECDETFLRSSVGVMLELHWAIVPPYYGFLLETEELLAAAERHELSGLSALVPCLEDLVLILSVNASKEMWRCLEWTMGIGVLAQRLAPPQWDRLLEASRRLGVERIVFLTLRLAQQLTACELPERIANFIDSASRIDALAKRVQQELFRSGSAIGELTRFRLAIRERWRDRVRYCWLRAVRPTHKDARVVKLPSYLFFVYYLIRPIRLLSSATRRHVQLFVYLAKLRRLSWPERRILFVALLALPASALGLRVWGISRIRDVLRRTQNHERSSREGEARSIARMVRIAAHHGLFRANCLEQSLTLWWLLKRRGIDTDLRIGAQKQEGKFAAHAWIELDGVALNDSDDVGERFGVFGAVHK